MRGININSRVTVPDNIWNKIYGRLTYLTPTYERVPIYLVDEQTMDRISPPKRCLNDECLASSLRRIDELLEEKSERLQEMRRSETETPRWVTAIDEILSECLTSKMVHLGVYLHDSQPQPDLAAELTKLIENAEYKHELLSQHPDFPKGEVIFICPERIYEHDNPELLFQKVVIHELAHAFVAGDRQTDYQKLYGRVIEESLANAVALSHFREKETPPLKAFIAKQPPEYRGCYYWMFSENEFIEKEFGSSPYLFLRAWKEEPATILFPFWLINLYPPHRLLIYLRYVYEFWPSPNIFPSHTSLEIWEEAIDIYRQKDDYRPICNLISKAILEFVA
ncbi:hypothetical protein [Thermoflavifilum thermophilum]|uniref:Uncharacterized protein n=1 Tax=Thermoflavifilum thermophilum TaxID=1393122 RepID=A0A1I7NFQ0_9BACT|nr:hypothetical protein [Thermoflavifilum thermophilum]SFV33478.1 hypothetical protein SAMN05660895_1721 [Thermoflavifilum thermophilum]